MASKKLVSNLKKIALLGAVTVAVPFAKNTMAHASNMQNINNGNHTDVQLSSKDSNYNNYTLPSHNDVNNALIRYQNRILTQRSQNLATVVSHKAALREQSHESDILSASAEPASASASNVSSLSSASVSSQPASFNTQQASGRAERHLERLAEYYTDVFINMYDQSDYKGLSHFVLGLADQANRDNLSHKVDISFSPASSSAAPAKPLRAKNTSFLSRSVSTSVASKPVSAIASTTSNASSASDENKHTSSMAYNATAHAGKQTADQKEFNKIVSKAATGLSHIASHFADQNANHQIFKHMFALAKTKLGDPYTWGGTGAHTFDCSGFTQYLYWHAAHHLIPRTAGAQYDDTKRIPESEAHLGDLVFFGGSPYNIEHVGLYLGHGYMIDAQLRGVIIEHVHAPWWDLVGFGRVKL